MREIIISLFIVFSFLNTSCFSESKKLQEDSDLHLGLVINRERAFEFSNNLVEDILAENIEEIYSKTDESFRQQYPIEKVRSNFEAMNSKFGKLIETKFKADEATYWRLPDDTNKPMRTFYYSAKTDKAEMGKYFLRVSVVEENEKLKCIYFSMDDYPQGIPEDLK